MPSASTDPVTARDSERQTEDNGFRPIEDAFELLYQSIASDPKRNRLVAPEVRRKAFETFAHLVVPGGKPGRDWKHDYARVAATIPLGGAAAGARSVEVTSPLLPPDSLAAQAGSASPYEQLQSDQDDAQGIKIGYGSTLNGAGAALRDEYFGTVVRWREDKFASLAVAFMQDGFLVHIPAGARPERPILIDQRVAGTSGSSFPYTLVVLEEGAEVTVVEDLNGVGFSCGIVEIVLRERARLNYVAVQRSDPESTVLMNRGAVCGADSACRFYVAELGGALSRSVVTTRLAGHGATSEVAGFFFNNGSQHVDLSTLVDHAVGDTTSRTTIKSAATGRGQGRYLGNIRIEADANGSDATLRDDALLLSKHAHIDSVPALEIASNDVKAFHGATVGSIDEAELFYAQSRGIERSAAERMIALGFFEPVVAAFPGEPLRDFLRASLAAKATTAPLAEVS